MSFSDPKRPSFARWLHTTGQITAGEYLTLNDEWGRVKPSGFEVYTTGPTTWDQFLARRYPRQFLTYQAYLRVIGAAPTFKKD